jgi:hypothetical protein
VGNFGKWRPTRVETGLLQCSCCEEMKPDEDFTLNGSHSMKRRRGRSASCRACKKRQHREKVSADPVKEKYKGHRATAKKRGHFSSLTLEQFRVLARVTTCEMCGTTLNTEVKRSLAMSNNAWTLDRVDNSKGYVEGNIGVLCRRCNYVKFSITALQAEQLHAYLKAKAPKP